mgnify:CR=1 FL=1
MTFYRQIKEDLKGAMRDKDELLLSTLRGLLSAFTNEQITQKNKPSDEISDELALLVIKRASKQRKDSIEQFEKGGRQDLADIEKKELLILEKYLPDMMNKDEIIKIAKSKKEEMDIKDKADMGILIGAIMKEASGKAEGGDVKKVVEELFT